MSFYVYISIWTYHPIPIENWVKSFPLLESNMISGGIDNLVASIHHIMKSYRYIIYDGQTIIHILS